VTIKQSNNTINTTSDKTISRRNFVKGAAAGWIFVQSGAALGLNISTINNAIPNKKLVWIFLRGALDALHTVVPTSDPDLMSHRGALLTPIKNKLLPLEKGYALHPSLSFLHQLYEQKQMAPIVAVASGYRERSHFDAQDQMESGLNVTDHNNGWLARVSEQIQANGIAISRSVPIALRSQTQRAETWYPSSFPEADEDLLSRLSEMYESDSALSENLNAVIAQKHNPNMQMEEKKRVNFPYLAQRCGELLSNNKIVQCAMLEIGGWDTHSNQQGRLSRQLKQLDDGIFKLKSALTNTWDDTLVVVSTEFGRTVAVNGTQGTDHGTASAMFLLGGALAKFDRKKAQIRGGHVHGTWPGLSSERLFEARDLMPTSDIRDWISEALTAHWQLTSSQINAIFPDAHA
jgi:uncharacterized protein (DUF1501 family)